MKVLLKKTNEIKEVSFGYAVNYLFPMGLAVTATEKIMAQKKRLEKNAEKKKAQKETKEKKRALAIKGKEFILKKKAGKADKLYAAINKKQLAEIIGVEKKEVVLEAPIKKTGEYEIQLQIGKIKEKVKIKVIDPKST